MTILNKQTSVMRWWWGSEAGLKWTNFPTPTCRVVYYGTSLVVPMGFSKTRNFKSIVFPYRGLHCNQNSSNFYRPIIRNRKNGQHTIFHLATHTPFCVTETKPQGFPDGPLHVLWLEKAITTQCRSGNAKFSLPRGYASCVNCSTCNFGGGQSVRNVHIF